MQPIPQSETLIYFQRLIGAPKIARILEVVVDRYHVILIDGVWPQFHLAILMPPIQRIVELDVYPTHHGAKRILQHVADEF